MGRRPDPEELQEKKGSPSKRKTKAERSALKVRKLLVEVRPPSARIEPPPWFHEPAFAGALKVWEELAPMLQSTHRLQAQHLPQFEKGCVAVAEWRALTAELYDKGFSQDVKTQSGAIFKRDVPAVRHRIQAEASMKLFAEAFGLTPREEYALFKDQSIARRENPGLFGDAPRAQSPAGELPLDGDDEVEAEEVSAIGGLSQLKSAPPSLN